VEKEGRKQLLFLQTRSILLRQDYSEAGNFQFFFSKISTSFLAFALIESQFSMSLLHTKWDKILKIQLHSI